MVCVPVYGQKMWAEFTGWGSNSRWELSGQTVGSNVVLTCHLEDVRYVSLYVFKYVYAYILSRLKNIILQFRNLLALLIILF